MMQIAMEGKWAEDFTVTTSDVNAEASFSREISIKANFLVNTSLMVDAEI